MSYWVSGMISRYCRCYSWWWWYTLGSTQWLSTFWIGRQIGDCRIFSPQIIFFILVWRWNHSSNGFFNFFRISKYVWLQKRALCIISLRTKTHWPWTFAVNCDRTARSYLRIEFLLFGVKQQQQQLWIIEQNQFPVKNKMHGYLTIFSLTIAIHNNTNNS